MIFDGAPIEVDVFCDADGAGSRQILHLYDEHGAMRRAFERYTVDDRFDHSFICFEAAERAQVLWKNSAGEIQFCGSAAYGLCWLALTRFDIPALQISSRHVDTSGFRRRDRVAMTMPCHRAVPLFSDSDGDLFFCPTSGVYLLHAKTGLDEINYAWLLTYLERKQIKNAHGFCAFAWQPDTGGGALRHFVPWHGRIEDYVTGSIHQCLTPLVYEIYNAREQRWRQLSSSGGGLVSRCEDGKVSLSGQCRLPTPR